MTDVDSWTVELQKNLKPLPPGNYRKQNLILKISIVMSFNSRFATEVKALGMDLIFLLINKVACTSLKTCQLCRLINNLI